METTKVGDKYNVLSVYFSSHLPWHKARIKFFVLLITALCKMQTIWFERLAEGMDSTAQISPCLRRIQRFFADFSIGNDKIASVLFSLLPCKTNLVISIDRTNWQFGKTDINIFMLSVCYDGIAFPLLWKMLPKRGNSNCEERIELIKKFIEQFGKDCIEAIVADREFIGKQWLRFLQSETIPYHIRIKDNMWFTKPDGEKIRMSWILQGCKTGEGYHHPKMLYLDKQWYMYQVGRLRTASILLSSPITNSTRHYLIYKQR